MPANQSNGDRRIPVLASAVLAWLLVSSIPSVAKAQNPWSLCAAAIAGVEQKTDLPRHLLSAISKGESGRWHRDSKTSKAWPWTVTAGGQGRFLPSKAAAIAEVERLRGEGISNIDVGCMQVNLRYHPQAFESLEAAFDPAHNVGYAARLLTGLRQQYRSWLRAIGYYHSKTPHLSNAYRRKVTKLWRAERRRENEERRKLRQAERSLAPGARG